MKGNGLAKCKGSASWSSVREHALSYRCRETLIVMRFVSARDRHGKKKSWDILVATKGTKKLSYTDYEAFILYF
jgi:hypothetical protein